MHPKDGEITSSRCRVKLFRTNEIIKSSYDHGAYSPPLVNVARVMVSPLTDVK